jgi:hypothetical protein
MHTEEPCLVGYDAVDSVENQSSFRKSLSPSSGLRSQPNKVKLPFIPEDGGDLFLQNVR